MILYSYATFEWSADCSGKELELNSNEAIFSMTASQGQRLKFLAILFLGLALIVPKWITVANNRSSKSFERYWEETGLSSKELESLLAEPVCYLNAQNFLACVNSVSNMLEKFNLALDQAGIIRNLTVQDIENAWNEKKELAKWRSTFSRVPRIQFLKIWRELDLQRVTPQERRSVIASGVNGFLSVFKDPHTYIVPIALYEEVIANSDAKQYSMGIIYKREKGQLLIRKVFPGSPAEIAGLRKFDRVIRLNGRDVPELLPSDVVDIFKMQTVGRVDMIIDRKNKQQRIEIVKGESFFPNVVSKILQGQRPTGLVTIHRFAKGVCEQTRAEVRGLLENAVQGLILDLRDNPGGQVDEASCVVNLFVKQGTVMFETRYINSTQTTDRYVAEKEPLFLGPISVLINAGSASAAEIVAGALKDAGRATLVGERSFGKGTFQDGRIWAANSKIALFQTEGFYYFPSGWTPQLVGLEPDLKVDFAGEEVLRESDQYFNPVMPPDIWTGPQTVGWLLERKCDFDSASMQTLSADLDADPQLKRANAWLNCGDLHDRHGSL